MEKQSPSDRARVASHELRVWAFCRPIVGFLMVVAGLSIIIGSLFIPLTLQASPGGVGAMLLCWFVGGGLAMGGQELLP